MNCNTLQKTEATQSYKPVANLLSKGETNAKTVKNSMQTYILYLAPANSVDGFNLCPFASPECIKLCLNSAGRGSFSNVQSSRINKSKFWAYNRAGFYRQLTNELLKIWTIAKRDGTEIAIRLNGTSDIDHLDLIKRYTGVNFLLPEYCQLYFYDYTKSEKMFFKYFGSNYKITFSLSEINEHIADKVLNAGGNVATVFMSQLPETYKGFQVIDGDLTDLRYFDPSNVIIGLRAKGKAKKAKNGFVITKHLNA